MARVCDLMNRSVVCCAPRDSLKTVANLMDTNQFRSVVVMHESGETWGLISFLDVIRFYYDDLENIHAEDVMRPYQIDVDPQWPIEKAISLMLRRKIQHLIIVDPHAGPKRPVAILTSFDIVRHMSQIETGHFEQMLRMHSG